MQKEDISLVSRFVTAILLFALGTVALGFFNQALYQFFMVGLKGIIIFFGAFVSVAGLISAYGKPKTSGNSVIWATIVVSATIWVAPLMIWFTPDFAKIHPITAVIGIVNLLLWGYIILRYYWSFTVASKDIIKVRDIFYRVWWPFNILYYFSVAAITVKLLLAG